MFRAGAGFLTPLLIVVALVTVGGIISNSSNYSVFTMANSALPMDNAGTTIPCHVCRTGVANATSGYHYKCVTRGCEFHAQYDASSGILKFW